MWSSDKSDLEQRPERLAVAMNLRASPTVGASLLAKNVSAARAI
ncbi:hypothetical protein C4K00_0167 [Pseudomonas synxantha]|nr:hypothetical protein C4K00_0167 [Pseudomonas synxantha]AZE75958.1 hypothetical protein C4J99_0140 [Pseudomonas synxantha]